MSTLPMRGLLAGLFASILLASCLSDSAEPAANESGTTNPPANAKSDTPKKPAAKPAAKNPNANMPDKAPAVFRVKFKTTVGDIVVECHRDWAPIGADRFFELVKKSFYDEIAFFRVVPNFVVQFGIHGDPEEAGEWRGSTLEDEPVKESNTRGTLTYAKSTVPNTRTTQMFINLKDNTSLDRQGFSPFAKVVEGMDVVAKIHNVGQRPRQANIQHQGNAYLKQNFPGITWIKGAEYLGEPKK